MSDELKDEEFIKFRDLANNIIRVRTKFIVGFIEASPIQQVQPGAPSLQHTILMHGINSQVKKEVLYEVMQQCGMIITELIH